MSNIIHNAIIVTSWDSDSIADLIEFCDKIEIPYVCSEQQTGGYKTLLIPPDGGEEGWDCSKEGDVKRGILKKYLIDTYRTCRWEWIEAEYGHESRDDPKITDSAWILQPQNKNVRKNFIKVCGKEVCEIDDKWHHYQYKAIMNATQKAYEIGVEEGKKGLEQKVIQWARERGIFEKATPATQMLKTVEELGELARGVAKKNIEEIKDAIGDVIVTLILQANMHGLSATDCLAAAYKVIANRKGEMVNGVFVKESNDE